MTKETGGPAFPIFSEQSAIAGGDYSNHMFSNGGMTLRDYFAAKALAAMLGNPHKEGVSRGSGGLKVFPVYAYEWADAMLEARK